MYASPAVALNIHEDSPPGGGCFGWWGGWLCRDLRLHQTPPQGCLLKERSGTDPIMKAHHRADQIRGQCGTPTF